MARMIPLHIPAATESPAERKLFDEFERACPSEWIVLHSLDLAQRGNGPLGEADFVVIAPGFGLLVIEAKTYLARTPEGLWRTHPTGPPHEKSPFVQANKAMYRIKEWVRQHNLPDVLATSVVIVPDMEVRTGRDQIEWSPRQLIDRSRYMSKSLEQLLMEEFDAQRAELEHPPAPLSRENAERIVRILRSEVECYISPKARIENQLAEVRRFTEEQFRVLDQMGGNPRLLVDGLAGTGKTLLAIEAARRAVDQGQRVLLVCYNRLLGDWLQAETEPWGDACTTATIHEFMQTIVGDTWKPGLTSDYWEVELPERVFDELAERSAMESAAQFDLLVIDEAQDILVNSGFVTVLESVLSQGLTNGRWIFFGDFGHQDIFGRMGTDPRKVLEATIGYAPPLVSLRENCRNLPRVADLAGKLGQVEGGYADCRRDDDGFDPRVLFYDGAKTAKKALTDALDTLVAEGFEPGQIVVLSRRSNRHCLASQIDTPPWSDRLKPLLEAGKGYTSYDSIYRFKGREAAAVVVTDIDPLEAEGHWSDSLDVRNLLYVAVTRALSRTVVLAHECWRDRLEWGPMDGTGLDAKEAAEIWAASGKDEPNDAGAALPEVPSEWFVRPNGVDASRTIHGISHTLRVWTHAMELADALELAAEEREALHFAALWHDIGRTNDAADYYHGAKSAGRVIGLGLHGPLDERIAEMALFAVTHHSGSEEHAERGVAWLSDPEATLRVFRVLKDADGLDRVRLGDLDESYLRFDVSRGRVDRARELLRELP